MVSAHHVSIQETPPPFDWAGSLGRWLIFSSGLAVLVAALILPAQRDLRETRLQRDLALHIEQTQHARIERYQDFLQKLEHPDPVTVDLLAMAQLGVIPADREAFVLPGHPPDPQLFEYLEPTPSPFVPAAVPASRLERLVTDNNTRLWITLLGGVAVLYGLLPATKS